MIDLNRLNDLLSHIASLITDSGESVRLDELVDKDGNTLLHMACFRNRTKIIDSLMNKAQQDLSKAELIKWVNRKTTTDQFTALHYASFRGNVPVIELLLQHGADKMAVNAFGLNVLHIAA